MLGFRGQSLDLRNLSTQDRHLGAARPDILSGVGEGALFKILSLEIELFSKSLGHTAMSTREIAPEENTWNHGPRLALGRPSLSQTCS